jgi:hypothetical protein
MNGFTSCSSPGGRLSATMGLVLWIGLGVAATCAVVLLDSAVADILGGVVAIGSLVAITRSVIELAGAAGSPREQQVTPGPGSPPGAPSRSR